MLFDSLQQAKPIHPPEVELPNFARPTASKLKKEDGKSSMYNSIPDKPVREPNTFLRNRKPEASPSNFKDVSLSLHSASAMGSHPQSGKNLSLNEELNSIVEVVLEDQDTLALLDQRKDYFVSFIESCSNLPENAVTNVFSRINEKVCTICFSIDHYQ